MCFGLDKKARSAALESRLISLVVLAPEWYAARNAALPDANHLHLAQQTAIILVGYSRQNNHKKRRLHPKSAVVNIRLVATVAMFHKPG